MNLRKRGFWLCTFAILLACVSSARALIELGGAEPVTDRNWPAGSVDVANQPSRVSWMEGPPFGGGEISFQYAGDAAALNGVLAKLAQIDAPQRLLVIHPGMGTNNYITRHGLLDKKSPLNWTFTVWNPERYYALFGNSAGILMTDYPEFHQPLPPPRIDAWADSPGLDWAKVHVPEGITVTDERAASHGYKPEDGSVITGVAYDMLTSKPVQHLEVMVAHNSNKQIGPAWIVDASARGDAAGRFELRKISPGFYAVSLRAPGYAGRMIGMWQFDAGTFKSFITRLSPAVSQAGTVVGADGKPLANVRVDASAVVAIDGSGYPPALPANDLQRTTDAQGRFTLTDLPMGHVQLGLGAVHYCQADPLRIVAVPSGNLTVTMARTGAIRIVARDTAGTPISGNITISDQRPDKVGTWGASFGLDHTGRCLIEAVPPAKYNVYLNRPPSAGKAAPVAVEVKPGQTAEALVTAAAD